jgi:hypothetical protein
MRRFGVCTATLMFAAVLWLAPAGAQDKFTTGTGGAT